jgi:hypothetical protein
MDVLTSIPYKIKKKTKDNQPFNFKKLIASPSNAPLGLSNDIEDIDIYNRMQTLTLEEILYYATIQFVNICN